MSLAQQLGLPEDAKIVVAHHDDTGMCHGSNAAFADIADKGFITCTSVMVPCPWFRELAEMAVKRPDYDIGVHLTLTSEWRHYRWRPLTGSSKATGLVDDEGYMWRNAKETREHAHPDAVEAELRARSRRRSRPASSRPISTATWRRRWRPSSSTSTCAWARR